MTPKERARLNVCVGIMRFLAVEILTLLREESRKVAEESWYEALAVALESLDAMVREL